MFPLFSGRNLFREAESREVRHFLETDGTARKRDSAIETGFDAASRDL